MRLALPDQVADRGNGLHDLEGRHPPLLVAGLHQDLREHADQVDRELHSHLLLRWERKGKNCLARVQPACVLIVYRMTV